MKHSIIELIIDDSGKLSGGRVLTFLVVLSYLYYAAVVFIQTGKVLDFPYGAAAIVGTLYASNKFSPTYSFTPRPPLAGINKPEEGDI